MKTLAALIMGVVVLCSTSYADVPLPGCQAGPVCLTFQANGFSTPGLVNAGSLVVNGVPITGGGSSGTFTGGTVPDPTTFLSSATFLSALSASQLRINGNADISGFSIFGSTFTPQPGQGTGGWLDGIPVIQAFSPAIFVPDVTTNGYTELEISGKQFGSGGGSGIGFNITDSSGALQGVGVVYATAFNSPNMYSQPETNVLLLGADTTNHVQMKLRADGSADIGGNLDPNTANGAGAIITLNTTGNVGIGVTAPTYKLHVAGDADVVGALGVSRSTDVTDIGPSIGVNSLIVEGGMVLVSDNGSIPAAYRAVGYGSAGGFFQGASANGTESAPSGTLAGQNMVRLVGRGLNGDDNLFGLSSGRIIISAAEDIFSTAHGTNIDMQVTANGTTALIDALFLENSGNVGIGTTTPAHKLDVVGDVNVTGSYLVNGSLLPSGSSVVISSSTSAFGTYATGAGISDVVSCGGFIFTSNQNDNTLTKLNVADGSFVSTIGICDSPAWLGCGDSSVIVACEGAQNQVVKMRVSDSVITATSTGHFEPYGMYVSSAYVWVAQESSNTVRQIDLLTFADVRTIVVGNNATATGPANLDTDGAGSLYLTVTSENSLTKIDINSGIVLSSTAVSTDPFGVIYCGGNLFVANNTSNDVKEFTTALTAVRTIPTGAGTFGITCDSGTYLLVGTASPKVLRASDGVIVSTIAYFNNGGPSAYVSSQNSFWSPGTGGTGVVRLNPITVNTHTCTTGQLGSDTGFIYACTSTNVWKRTSISSF